MKFLPRWREIAVGVLIAIPALSLALSAISWLHYGLDIPFYDDFRAYYLGRAASLALKDLFSPSNDTFYTVGLALDALAQRYLNGNVVAYQFLSMIGLVGGLLFLQWRLLSWAVEDRLVAAAAFSLTVFTIQPGSYWGLQALAYHQGLPTLFLWGALSIVVHPKWGPRWGVPAVFILGLLAGLSYISGAFGALAAALAMLGLSLLALPTRRALRAGGAALLASALLTCAIQGSAILYFQKGRIHDPVATWTLPTEASFWLYLLGKVSRALALPSEHPLPNAIVAIVLCVLVVVLVAALAWRAVKNPQASETRTTVVFVVALSILTAYLAILSAGRAGLQGSGYDSKLDVVSAGQHGFHFFWLTLLLPWIAAAGFAALTDLYAFRLRRLTPAVPVAAILVMVWGICFGGVMSHAAYYRAQTAWRLANDAACVLEAATEGKMNCPRWYDPLELFAAIDHARTISASFTRYLPLREPPPISDDPSLLFRFSAAPTDSIDFINVPPPVRTEDGFAFRPQHDPILIVKLRHGTLRDCAELEVNGLLKIATNDALRVYLLRPGQTSFAEPPAAGAQIAGNDANFTSFMLSARSMEGFGDFVRVDPVVGDQSFTMRDLEIHCRTRFARQGG